MNKKGVNLFYGTVIFIVLNILFFTTMFLFVQRASENVIFYEQKYSKQIALLVDVAKPGTIIKLNVDELEIFIDKNNLVENEIVNFQEGNVLVKLTNGKGYSFAHSSNYVIDKSFERKINGELNLVLQVRENNE